MFSLVSEVRKLFPGTSRLALAGISAIPLVLPSLAGATFLPSHDSSWDGSAAGGSPPPHDFSLGFRDFHSEIVERAARDFDCDFPGLPALAEGFEHAGFRKPDDDVAKSDGWAKYPWIAEARSQGHAWFGSELDAKRFCKFERPTEVPEPGTALLLAGGLIALARARRERRV